MVPSKNGQLTESSNQIPPGSNVAGDEDPKGEDREGVHESAAIIRTLLSLGLAHWEFNDQKLWRDYNSRDLVPVQEEPLFRRRRCCLNCQGQQ